MSWLGEVPTRSARIVRSSLSRTWMTSAPSTTWALVRTSPSAEMIDAGAGPELHDLVGRRPDRAGWTRRRVTPSPAASGGRARRPSGPPGRPGPPVVSPRARSAAAERPAAKPTPPATRAPTRPPATAPRSPGRARRVGVRPAADAGGGNGLGGGAGIVERVGHRGRSVVVLIIHPGTRTAVGERRVPEIPRHTGNWKRASDVTAAYPRGAE